ncbi:MAG TPA: hypothetical protein VJV79_26905 [Polyangiaceae bacterium]|nr:hypothetical protein [Polyangiaceae bacterium]
MIRASTALRMLGVLSLVFGSGCAICEPGLLIKDNFDNFGEAASDCSFGKGVKGKNESARCMRARGYLAIPGELLIRAAAENAKRKSPPNSSNAAPTHAPNASTAPTSSNVPSTICACNSMRVGSRAGE